MTSRTPRLLAMALAAVPLTLGTLSVTALPSGAAALTSRTVCKTLKATFGAPTAALGRCTAATTGGSGTIAGISPNTDVVTWKNGGTTTFSYTHVLVADDVCPTGADEYRWAGKVISDTGPASAVAGKISALVCVTTTGTSKVYLLKGTVWKF